MKTQVHFRFPDRTEVRWVDAVPDFGEKFTSDGRPYDVIAIEDDGHDKVTCVLAPLGERSSLISDLYDRAHELERDRIAWNLPDRSPAELRAPVDGEWPPWPFVKQEPVA